MSNSLRSEHPSAVNLSVTKNLRYDLPASVVVFLIALPLCLGIAVASNAPPFAGIISGIVGGLIVAPLSRSPLAVSGPAAGLTVIVIDGITTLGTYEAFLVAVIISGLLQIVMGALRAGVIAYYVPSAVVRGMLAGIGVTLILKQIPHAVGWDQDTEGDYAFFQADGENTFTELVRALEHIHWGAVLVAGLGLAVVLLWPKIPNEKLRGFPSALIVVLVGVGTNAILVAMGSPLAMTGDHLVKLPDVLGDTSPLITPDWAAFARPEAWKVGAIIAVVGSVETLLCLEAVDKQDKFGRESPKSRELLAQGAGNSVAGLLGGIPLTAVIVRGSANVQAGGRTGASAFFHGVLLLVCVVAIPEVLNLIPLSALAVVLLHVGYKLASPEKIKAVIAEGRTQWLAFFATMGGILFIDLLQGVLIGLAIGMFFVLRVHANASYFVHDLEEENEDGTKRVRMELSENVSFMNKAALKSYLHALERGAHITIDASRSLHIDHDAREVIMEFLRTAPKRGITVEAMGLISPEEEAERYGKFPVPTDHH